MSKLKVTYPLVEVETAFTVYVEAVNTCTVNSNTIGAYILLLLLLKSYSVHCKRRKKMN
jgi:hypothetical protein